MSWYGPGAASGRTLMATSATRGPRIRAAVTSTPGEADMIVAPGSKFSPVTLRTLPTVPVTTDGGVIALMAGTLEETTVTFAVAVRAPPIPDAVPEKTSGIDPTGADSLAVTTSACALPGVSVKTDGSTESAAGGVVLTAIVPSKPPVPVAVTFTIPDPPATSERPGGETASEKSPVGGGGGGGGGGAPVT